ncbi:MAG: DUF1573 domain-containing protein [Planctomycetaceae bacterium]|nr:DUF1573 domain-containing protein [Planctomycetaceae bacterium]
MPRSISSAILVSCIAGVLLGLGTAYSFLNINAWQPENETKNLEMLAERARGQTTGALPQASIEVTTYNFGLMDSKEEGFHDFFITNTGNADLILRVDRTSCSCLGIDITPTRVRPGGTARCRLRYTAEQAATGLFSQGGVVTTNDPENREIFLNVEGVFTNPVVMQPTSVNFARVPAGTTQTRTIRFYGFENEPLQLSATAWELRDFIDIEFQPSELRESDDDGMFLSFAKSVVEGTITVKPGLPVGTFQDWFQLRTNYAGQPNVNFLVNGQVVAGNVAISGQGYNRTTGVADLGRTTQGQGISRDFMITMSGISAQSAAIQISSVEPAWLRTRLSEPTQAGSRRIVSLTIEVPENAPIGSFLFGGDGQQAHIVLETNDETIRIPLQFSVGM